MITENYVQEVQSLVLTKIPGLTLAGACELSAFPLEEIKTVLAQYSPPTDKQSPYASFKKKLYAFCEGNRIKPLWAEAYRYREALGFTKDSPKETLKKGMAQSTSTQSKTAFQRKYTQPDYVTLFDEFETRRRLRLEPKDMPNPFTARKAGMLKDMQLGLDYHEQQEKERAEILRRRVEPDNEIVSVAAQFEPQPTTPDGQEINKLVSDLKDSIATNTNTLPEEKIRVWSDLDSKTKAAYFKALYKSKEPLAPGEEIVVEDASVWELVEEVPDLDAPLE